MRNIKVPKAVGNYLTRRAYYDLIHDSIAKVTKSGGITLDGYENDNQRVKFTYGGRRCTLFGVSKVNLEKGMLTLTVLNKGDLWDLPVALNDLRFKTLDLIAYEVYDYCKGENDRDYEEEIKDTIAGWMDYYREAHS